MAIDFQEEHLTELAETAQLSKSNAQRLDKVETAIDSLKNENKILYEMSASVKTLADSVGIIKIDVTTIKNEQCDMKNEISEIKNTPNVEKAKLFDGSLKLVATAVGTGVIAFILGQICPVIFK